jgi:hypothetical protein
LRIRNVPLGTLALEFVVVVLGVLIALAVDQAVENRREKQLEQAYLNALTSDVESDLAALRQEFLPAIDQREARAREVIEVVEDSGDPDPVRIAVSLDFAGHLSVFEPQRSTFDDLIATGGFRLIRDRRVRSEVVSYYAVSRLNDMHELIRNEIWYEYRPVIDEVLDPIFVAELTRIEREVGGGYDELVEAVTSEWVGSALDLETLRSSSTFRAGIASALEYTFVQRSLYLERVLLAERLLGLLSGVH